MKNWYYYLHTNGDLIGKNPVIVESDNEYFNSPFVQKVWNIDLEDRGSIWDFVLEALTIGARLDRIKELAEKWKLNYEDSKEYIQRRKPTETLQKGLRLFAEKVLNMNPEDYFDKLAKDKPSEVADEGGKSEKG